MRLLASLLAGLPLLASHAYAALEVNLDDPGMYLLALTSLSGYVFVCVSVCDVQSGTT